MPFARDLDTLRPLIEKALKDDEMLDGAGDAGLSVDDLKVEIEVNRKNIFEAVGSDITEFRSKEAAYESLSFRVRWQTWAGRVRWAAFALLSALLSRFIYEVYSNDLIHATSLAFTTLPLMLVGGLLLVFTLAHIVHVWISQRKPLSINRAERDAQHRNLVKLREDIEKKIVEHIREECREIFEQRSVPSYETELKVEAGKARGLAEVPGMSRAVNTGARRRLRNLLETMPGGSIGIAGPRGAGKTTLIWDYCCGAVEKLRGRPVLGVLTSAPVQYEARDFILYLFLSVCRAVLRRAGADLNSPPWLSEAGPLSRFVRKENRARGLFIMGVGASSVMVSFLMVIPPTGDNFVFVMMRAIGITPLHVFVLGLLLSLAGWLLLQGGLRAIQKSAPALKDSSSPMGGAAGERYVQKAWDWVKMIKFQQSFTTGWSGALKLPVGLEGGANRAASLAENQKSLPEIVGGLREFLEDLSADFRVVVGIDELDKLDSDEAAQRFVNEIKSVFGLRDCFYLVSVSESAMSNFERRGVPFRDAFDSSFDNIIRVDYLTLDAAKRLIARRVVGMSMPFRCLCYCLSGGLARDLIRACRHLVELVDDAPDKAGPPPSRKLADLCAALVRQDVKSKVQAVITSASKIELEPEGPAFIAALYGLEEALDDGRALLPECAAGLNVSLARVLSADKEEAKLLAERRLKLAALGRELATYVYYADTLLLFFGTRFDEEKLKGAETPGRHDSLNYLARARQSLSVNPAISKSIIDDFRAAHGFDVVQLWEPAPGAQLQAQGAPNGEGRAAAAFIITDLPAALQKSIEGLKGVLNDIAPDPEES